MTKAQIEKIATTDCYMTRHYIKKWLSESRCPSFAEHEELESLVTVFSNPDYGYEETEVVFAVPADWLVSYMDKESGRREWNREKVRSWLKDEYTSEDSRRILKKAVSEEKLVLWQIK